MSKEENRFHVPLDELLGLRTEARIERLECTSIRNCSPAHSARFAANLQHRIDHRLILKLGRHWKWIQFLVGAFNKHAKPTAGAPNHRSAPSCGTLVT
jgi:hypothetical protein